MRKTSFGQMDVLFLTDGNPVVEYLEFDREGRSHRHPVYESFTVLSGSGEVISGDERFSVTVGDIVTIPPDTPHWMVPADGQKMTGVLWYHADASVVGKR